MATPLGGPSQGLTLLVKNVYTSALKEGTLVGFEVGGAGATASGEPTARFVDDQTQPSDFGSGNRRFGNKDMIAVPCSVDTATMYDYVVGGVASQNEFFGAANILGVLVQDLEVGEIGDALMVGVIQVLSNGAAGYSNISKGQAICSTGSGFITNANFNTNKTNSAFGFALEDATKGEKCWCYINTLGYGNEASNLFATLSKYRGKIF